MRRYGRGLRFQCVPLLRPSFVRTEQDGTVGAERFNKASFFGDDNSIVLAGMTQGVFSWREATKMFCTISTPYVAYGQEPAILWGAAATAVIVCL